MEQPDIPDRPDPNPRVPEGTEPWAEEEAAEAVRRAAECIRRSREVARELVDLAAPPPSGWEPKQWNALVVPGTREQRAEFAAHQPRTQNADSHAIAAPI
jgi:hypothetical protein